MSAEVKFECSVCGDVFPDVLALRVHLREHASRALTESDRSAESRQRVVPVPPELTRLGASADSGGNVAEPSVRSRRRLITLVVAVVLVLVALAGALVSHSQLKRQLDAWGLLPRTQKMTELYFTSPSSLPADFSPRRATPVAFTVHNLEHETVRYRYKIIERSDSGSRPSVLDSGTFTLPSGGYHEELASVLLEPFSRRVAVEVSLEDQGSSIYFWVHKQT